MSVPDAETRAEWSRRVQDGLGLTLLQQSAALDALEEAERRAKAAERLLAEGPSTDDRLVLTTKLEYAWSQGRRRRMDLADVALAWMRDWQAARAGGGAGPGEEPT